MVKQSRENKIDSTSIKEGIPKNKSTTLKAVLSPNYTVFLPIIIVENTVIF